MPSLAEVQRAMRRSLLSGDSAAAAFVVADGIAAADRLAICRNTFESVATRALRLSHPAVAKLVGDDFFDACARAHVVSRPPSCAWLDRYGAGFSGFLARWRPAAALGYLADVARLEWSVSRALHARDAAALDALALESLTALDPQAQAAVRLERHPSLRLLCTRTAADAIWRATLGSDDGALAALDPHAGPRWLLVERTSSGVDVTALSEAGWRFTLDLCARRSIRQALDRAHAFAATADRDPDRGSSGSTPCDRFDPAALLGAHLAAGRFTAFEVGARCGTGRTRARPAGCRDAGAPTESLEETWQ